MHIRLLRILSCLEYFIVLCMFKSCVCLVTVLPHYFNIIPVLISFSFLTGAGPTGLRIQHFIDAADVPLSCSILQSLKGVVNILVAGRAPPMIASFLAGGNLTALVKSMQDSSLDIRPIAVGEACGSIEKRWGLGGTEERWDYKCVEGD